MSTFPAQFQSPVDSFFPQKDRELLQLELFMGQRINQEREALGLSALAPHALLAAVARAHSAEMRDLDYFSHESPTARFRTHVNRYEYAFGKQPRLLSENISGRIVRGAFNPQDAVEKWERQCINARAYSLQEGVERSHQGLMQSPGHRVNILHPAVEIMGIGIVSRSRDFWVTQVFSVR